MRCHPPYHRDIRLWTSSELGPAFLPRQRETRRAKASDWTVKERKEREIMDTGSSSSRIQKRFFCSCTTGIDLNLPLLSLSLSCSFCRLCKPCLSLQDFIAFFVIMQGDLKKPFLPSSSSSPSPSYSLSAALSSPFSWRTFEKERKGSRRNARSLWQTEEEFMTELSPPSASFLTKQDINFLVGSVAEFFTRDIHGRHNATHTRVSAYLLPG